MAITSAFQADDAGSIPASRSSYYCFDMLRNNASCKWRWIVANKKLIFQFETNAFSQKASKP